MLVWLISPLSSESSHTFLEDLNPPLPLPAPRPPRPRPRPRPRPADDAPRFLYRLLQGGKRRRRLKKVGRPFLVRVVGRDEWEGGVDVTETVVRLGKRES